MVLPSEPVMLMIGHGQTAKKKLHLVGDLRAVCARLLKETRVNARGTEDNVLIERIKVMRAENEVYAEGSEGSIAVAKLGGFFLSCTVTRTPAARSIRMSGILLTPAPITPTRLSDRPPRYCSNAVINA